VIRALLHVTPSQVQFGSVAAKKQPGRNLILVNNRSGGVPVKVTGAMVDDPAFAAEVVTIEDGRRYQVTVTIAPDASPGQRDAVLVLKTTDSEFPQVEIPVRANIS
jgi:DNA segregation ATPase FtsK/SpoIIIE-like protein